MHLFTVETRDVIDTPSIDASHISLHWYVYRHKLVFNRYFKGAWEQNDIMLRYAIGAVLLLSQSSSNCPYADLGCIFAEPWQVPTLITVYQLGSTCDSLLSYTLFFTHKNIITVYLIKCNWVWYQTRLYLLDLVLSWQSTTILFCLLFKYIYSLPSARICWWVLLSLLEKLSVWLVGR